MSIVRATSLVVFLLLVGCASVYPYAGGGCYVNFNKEWVDQNVDELKWTGKCAGEESLANGNGVLTFKTKDGKTRTYRGAMNVGRYYGQGDYTDFEGMRYVGEFSDGYITKGKMYDKAGRLQFEGTFTDFNPVEGTLYEKDGAKVTGRFDGKYNYDTRFGSFLYGEIVEANGKKRWMADNTYYDTLEKFNAAMPAYLQTLAARQAREAAEKAAAEQAEYQRQQEQYRLQQEQAARDAQAWTDALTQVANAYVAGQQQQADYNAQLQQQQYQQQLAYQQQQQQQYQQQQYQQQQQLAYQQQQQQFQQWQQQQQQAQLQQQQQAQQQQQLAYQQQQQQQVDQMNAQARQQAEQLRQQNEAFAAQNANASNCLTLVPEPTTYGGFINHCNYRVDVTWCNDGATGQGLGNFSDAFDCRKGQFGSSGVPANGTSANHTKAPMVYWFACREPYTALYGRFTGSGVVATCKK